MPLQAATEDDRPKRVVIYARYSPKSKDRKDRTETIETQVKVCRDHCRKMKWPVPKATKAFSDMLKSGEDEQRPGLWAAVDSLTKGDVLLVYRLDRLARGVYLSHVVDRAIDTARARLVSVADQGTWTDTAEDEFIRNIFRALDQYNRRAGAYRTKQAMLRQQAGGKRMSKLPPYGMRVDPQDFSRLILDQEEQEAIARCIELDREGLSLRQIAGELDEERYSARTGIWHHSQVRHILRRARDAAARDGQH